MPRPPALPRASPLRRRLLRLYDALSRRFGPPSGWRARSRPDPLAPLGRGLGLSLAEARRLREAIRRQARRHGGHLRRFLRQPAVDLRAALRAVPGIAPATADAVLLHAAGRPVFVVDANTRRVLSRHRIVAPGADLAAVQARIMANLPRDPALFQEYHALLVRVAKEYCRRMPRCEACPLWFDLGGQPPAGVRRRRATRT
jgi:endonuclease III related protein